MFSKNISLTIQIVITDLHCTYIQQLINCFFCLCTHIFPSQQNINIPKHAHVFQLGLTLYIPELCVHVFESLILSVLNKFSFFTSCLVFFSLKICVFENTMAYALCLSSLYFNYFFCFTLDLLEIFIFFSCFSYPTRCCCFATFASSNIQPYVNRN